MSLTGPSVSRFVKDSQEAEELVVGKVPINDIAEFVQRGHNVRNLLFPGSFVIYVDGTDGALAG